jgi:hypothetical protein
LNSTAHGQQEAKTKIQRWGHFDEKRAMAGPIILAFALAASIPTLNLQSSCRPASAAALPEDRALAYQSCIRDEQNARAEIVREWPKFTAAARATCSDEGRQFSPSYVDLLTCLEMSSGGEFSTGAGAASASVGTAAGSSAPSSPSATQSANTNFSAFQLSVPTPVVGPAVPVANVVNVPQPSLPLSVPRAPPKASGAKDPPAMHAMNTGRWRKLR